MAKKEDIMNPQEKAGENVDKKEAEGQEQQNAGAATKPAKPRKKPDASSKLKALQEELAEQKEKYLRLRKRMRI